MFVTAEPITQSDVDLVVFLATRVPHKVARERVGFTSRTSEYDKTTAKNLAFIRNEQLRESTR